MKKSFYAALALVGVLAFSAAAQTPDEAGHNEADGADHSGHDHSRPAKNPADETQVDQFWRLSDEAFHDGDYPRAISFHKAIVLLDPHDTESYGNAAWLMWSLGQKDQALAHIARGLKANPTDSEMWDVAGQQYDLQKKETPALAVKAKDAFADAVKFLTADADKNDAQMLRRRLAHAAEKAGDLPLSISTWRQLVADFHKDAVNKNNLARVENLRNAKTKTALLPFAAGSVGIATVALVGGVLRARKQRLGDKSPVEASTLA